MNEPSRLDEHTYDSSRIYLKAALEHMLEAGRSVRDLSEFALEKFGADFMPYLRQFLHDVGHGRVSIKGLSRSAQAALHGHSVSREEREGMIREAAYLRAERRGFCGGSPEQDWLEAEREVDLRLAHGEGLVERGGRALAAVAATVEQELASSKQVVTRWLDRKFPARTAAGRKNPATPKTRSGSRSAGSTPRASAGTKQQPTRKKVSKKTPAGGATAAGKAAAGKKTSKAQAAKKTASRKKTPSGRNASPAPGGTSASRKPSATKKKTTPTARKKTTTKNRAPGGKAARKQGRSGSR